MGNRPAVQLTAGGLSISDLRVLASFSKLTNSGSDMNTGITAFLGAVLASA